ncbi:Phage phiEco32-like COOH.NH2 ligase-type 2 [Paenibacillus sp. OV219]|nr:Phage phiEco32-like COOH.NH2 ligase-type 2 [Paenibacillus sp. OV219]
MGGSVWIVNGIERIRISVSGMLEQDKGKDWDKYEDKFKDKVGVSDDCSDVPVHGDVIIVGGKGYISTETLPKYHALNDGASIFAAESEDAIRRRLRRAGVAVWSGNRSESSRASASASASGSESERARGSRSTSPGTSANPFEQPGVAHRGFRVSLFQLLPIMVERLPLHGSSVMMRGSGRSEQLQEEDSRYRPLTRLAARALYACGLDCGSVFIHADEQGRLFVASVSLPPSQQLLDAESIWGKAVTQLAQQLGDIRIGSGQQQQVLLGADPEFLLLSESGKVVSAFRYLEGGHGAGCDSVLIGGQIKYSVAELRPAPTDSPAELARNIQKLLQLAAKRIPDQPPLRWAAGGMPAAGFSLGGHLHLSGVPLTGRLLRLLDSYIAFPLAMIESPAEHKRRPRYGNLGDFRLQPHGGFEYRTLPSWLVSPLAAKAAFALALLCARESGTLEACPSAEERYIDAYYAGDRDALRGCLDDLAASIAQTKSYRELAGWIEPLLAAIRSGRTWDTGIDIRVKWGILRADAH